jgi:hypothetical protein
MKKDDQPTSAGTGAAEDLEEASLDTMYDALEISPKELTWAEAKARNERYGCNELVDKEASDLERFLLFFWRPSG